MDSYLLYGITIVLLLLSFFKDRKKTSMALKKGWKAFDNILPEFLVVILFVGVMLAVMMVGVVTIPVEIKYFGRKMTLLRNFMAFLFSFFVAYVIGKVAG